MPVLLGRAGDLMGRVEAVVDRAEDLLQRGETTMAAVLVAVVARAGGAVAGVRR